CPPTIEILRREIGLLRQTIPFGVAIAALGPGIGATTDATTTATAIEWCQHHRRIGDALEEHDQFECGSFGSLLHHACFEFNFFVWYNGEEERRSASQRERERCCFGLFCFVFLVDKTHHTDSPYR